MQKRTVIRLGDVFKVKCGDYYRFFQYIADDMTMLNSRVIMVFKERYPLEKIPELSKVVQGEIEFYAHTSVKLGIKMGLWEKIGQVPVLRKIDVLFRRSKDYTEGNKVTVSARWEVWRINEDFQYVGRLKGENRKSEIGLVEPPIEIVERIKRGKYSYYYPDYE